MSSGRALCVLLCCMYYAAIVSSYALVESQHFDFVEMHFEPPPLVYQMLGAVLGILPAFWLPLGSNRPSVVCSWILYLTVVAPMTFVPYHILDRSPVEVVVLPLTIVGLFLLMSVLTTLPRLRLPQPGGNSRLVVWCLQALLVVLGLLVAGVDGQFRLNLSLEDVYLRRFAARDAVGDGSMTAYAISTLTYAVAPVCLLLGVLRRRWGLVGMATLAFLTVYSYRATKTDLFMPLFLSGLAVALAWQKVRFGTLVAAAALAVVVTSIGLQVIFDSPTLSAYLVRRQIMVPSVLTSFYWDFFLDRPAMLYTDRFYGRFFFEPRYDMTLTRLIGYEYFGRDSVNANTCFWASAFANLGYGGMIALTAALSWLLRLYDSIAATANNVLCSAMAGLLAFQLSNGALENCMITGGVAVTVVLLYFLRSDARPARATSHPHGMRTTLPGQISRRAA